MELALIKKIRDKIAGKILKEVPMIDDTVGQVILDKHGKVTYRTVPGPLYIRLDNEHGIETIITECIWHDDEKYLEWFETPIRGNTSITPNIGNSDANMPMVVMVSYADYDQIQQISWIPDQDQFKKYLDKLEGKFYEDVPFNKKFADRIYKKYCVNTRQEIMIPADNPPPLPVGKPAKPWNK